ncbi:hypothetical protein ACIRST_21920 [Kitasatospora sp. NPDC101447]|uniref:hypothetical protein n=1 Tax=Kitasatospora sp. NPDC101447 TaxID=3364102 RepID=UPI0038024E42
MLALSQQDVTMTNLKNRAMGLITISALVGTFSSFFGFGAKDHPLPLWFAIVVIAFVFLILLCVSYILSPAKKWNFGPDPMLIMAAQDYEHRIVWAAAKGMAGAVEKNSEAIARRAWVFFAGVVLLSFEAAFVVAASIGAR